MPNDKQYISQVLLSSSTVPYYIKDSEAWSRLDELEGNVSNLSGPMHLVGHATVEITDGSTTNPQIVLNDYDFSQAKAGDVVLWDNKEFVWTGLAWELLGDEGSYVLKTYDHVYQPAGSVNTPNFTGTTRP